MPKLNWFFSLVATLGISSMAVLPAQGQAFLPYTPEIDSEALEKQGLLLIQDAIQLIRLQQLERALPAAKLATQLAPSYYQTWFVLGNLYIQKKDLDQGIALLEKARKIEPEDANILFTLGNAYFQQKDYAGAIKAIKTGLKLNPESPAAFFDLGNAYLMSNQYD
ncbi:MAG: tetratricopeptide repeat protein, partial [Cyanobacteria bacterium J083]